MKSDIQPLKKNTVMKKFIGMILLAITAMLTTGTPCEAKRHNRIEWKKFKKAHKQWCVNVTSCMDDMGYSNDGNIHLFSRLVSLMNPKPPSDRMVDWYLKIAPRGVCSAIEEGRKTYFHYEDGSVVEVNSYEQLANIKSQLYD